MDGLLSQDYLGNSKLFGSSGGNFKSIQNGIATIADTALTTNITISSVLTANSIILVSFVNTAASNPTDDSIYCRADFISGTQFSLTRRASSGSLTIIWTVIEFANIKSLQTGQTALTGRITPQTVAISAVNPSRCIMFISYDVVTASTFAENVVYYVSSATQITFQEQSSNGKTARWFVVEFP